MSVNKKPVKGIIQQQDWQVIGKKKRRYNSYQGTVGKIVPNRLKRDFMVTKHCEKWVTDVTEFKALNGKKYYLSPILDIFNNEIIAYKLSRSPNFQQIQDMLQQTLRKLPKNANPILHSEQSFLFPTVTRSSLLFLLLSK